MKELARENIMNIDDIIDYLKDGKTSDYQTKNIPITKIGPIIKGLIEYKKQFKDFVKKCGGQNNSVTVKKQQTKQQIKYKQWMQFYDNALVMMDKGKQIKHDPYTCSCMGTLVQFYQNNWHKVNTTYSNLVKQKITDKFWDKVAKLIECAGIKIEFKQINSVKDQQHQAQISKQRKNESGKESNPSKDLKKITYAMSQAQFKSIQMLQNLLISPTTTDKAYRKLELEFQKNNYVPRGLMNVLEQQMSKISSVLYFLAELYYIDISKVYISDIKGDTYAEKCKYLASGISNMVKQKLVQMQNQGIQLQSKSCSLQNLFNSYSNYFTSQQKELNKILEQICKENPSVSQKQKNSIAKLQKDSDVFHRLLGKSPAEKVFQQKLSTTANQSKEIEMQNKQTNLLQQALVVANEEKRKQASQIEQLKQEIDKLINENCQLAGQIEGLKTQNQNNKIKYEKQLNRILDQKLFYEGLALKNYSYQQIKDLDNKNTEQIFVKIYENYKKKNNGIVQYFTEANSVWQKKKFIAQILKLTQGQSYNQQQKVRQVSTLTQTDQEKIDKTELKKYRQQSIDRFNSNIKNPIDQQKRFNTSTISQETQLSLEFIDQTKVFSNISNQQFVITQLKQCLNKSEILNYNLLHVSSHHEIFAVVFESPNTLILITTKSGHTFAGYTSLGLNDNSLLSRTMIVSTSTKMAYLPTSASSQQQQSYIMKQDKRTISISTGNLILKLKYKQNDKFWTMSMVTDDQEVLKHEKQQIMDKQGKQQKQKDSCRLIENNTLEIDVEKFCVYQLILDNVQHEKISDEKNDIKRITEQRQLKENQSEIKNLKEILQQYKKREDDANAAISQSKDQLAKLASQLKDFKQKQASLTYQLTKSSAQYTELQKKYKTMQKQYERIDQNLSQIKTTLIQYQSKLLEQKNKGLQSQQKLTALTKEITELQQKLSKFEKKIQQQQQIQKKDVSDQKDNKLITQIVLQQDLNKLQQQNKSEFKQKNKQQQKNIQNQHAESASINQQINNLQNKLKQKQLSIEELRSKLVEQQKQNKKLLKKFQTQKEKRNQNKQIEDLNKIKADVQQIIKKKTQIEQQQLKIRKSVADWTSRENKIKISVKQMQDRIKLLQQQAVQSENINQYKTQNLPCNTGAIKEKQQNSEKQEQKSNTQTSQTADDLVKTTNELEQSKQQKVSLLQQLTKQQNKYAQLQKQYKKIQKQWEEISIDLSEAKTAITEYQTKLNSQTKQISQLQQKLANSANKIKQLQGKNIKQIDDSNNKKMQYEQQNKQQTNRTQYQQKGKQQENIQNGQVQTITTNMDQQMNKLRDQLKQKQLIVQKMILKLTEQQRLFAQMEQNMKKQQQEQKTKSEKQITVKNKQIQLLTQTIRKLKQQTVQADQNMTRERKASVNKDKNKEKEDVTNIKADIQQLNKRKGQLQQQQLKIKKSVTDWSSREKKIKTSVEEMQARVKLLQQQEAQSKKIIQNIEQYKTQQLSLQQKVTSLTKQIQDLTTKLAALQSQVKIYQQKSKNTKLQLKGQQAELKNLNQIKKQIQQKSKKYEQINQKIATASIKLQQIQKKHNDQESKFEQQIKVLEQNTKTSRNNFQVIQKKRRELQMQIKKLQNQKLKYGGYPDRHFVGEVIQYEEDRQYILEKLRQLYDYKQVTKTKLLYSFSLMRSLNPHINVDDIPYYIILIKFKNCVSEGRNYIAALHSQQPLIQQNGSTNRGKGFISAVTKQTTFYLRTTDVHNPRLTEYNQFYFVFGNSQIRMMVGSNKFQTNIGHQYKSFNTKDHKNPEIFTGDKQQNAEMLDYEIYQVFFGN